MSDQPHILVLCGRNKRRSRTAECIFKQDSRFHIRSAGLSTKSGRIVTEKDLRWADLVFVMVPEQREKLGVHFRQVDLPPVEVLHIEDEYEFMDEELVDRLKDRINQTLKHHYNL